MDNKVSPNVSTINMPKSADKFDKLSSHRKDELTAFGFIKQCQKLLPDIAYYNIPKGIYNICFEYYHINNIFNEEYGSITGRGLQFDINGRGVQKTSDYQFATAIFADAVTNKTCNQYDVHIKWCNKVSDFYMGYIHTNAHEWIKNGSLQHCIGSYNNSKYSVGFHVYSGCNDFMIYDKVHPSGTPSDQFVGKLGEGDVDIFIMSFNFSKNELIVYWNGGKVHSMSLHGAKIIIPAFSFYRNGEGIEILKNEFSSKSKEN